MSISCPFTVSFIVPAYNVENDISQCIESIVNDAESASTDYEVIIVENGSSDHTYDVSKQLSHKYEQVTLATSKKGVSCARNVGIKMASGDKIIFVDADDRWVYGALKNIISWFTKQNVDLLIGSYYKSGGKVIYDYQSIGLVITGNELIDCRAWMLSRPNQRMTVWAKIFDRKLIVKGQVYFNENLNFSEDSEFLFRYTKVCNSICITNTAIYEYRCCNDSAMHTVNKKRISGYLNSLRITKKLTENEAPEIKKAFSEYALIHFNLICVHDIYDVKNRTSFFERMKMMKALEGSEIFAGALAAIPIRKCINMQLLPEFFIKCHVPFFSGMICYIKSYLNHREGTSV